MSEEDFCKGLPTREQIEAHYEPGKPYGYWQSQTGSLFRLGWSADGLVGDCRPWNGGDELNKLPECIRHAPIELALDRAHALLDRAVDTLWAAGSEDDKATVRRFFRDALKSEYGKAGMAFGAGALLPHAADAAGALLPSESNAPRYLNRAAWLFTERGATIVAREIGSTAIDSIGPLIGALRMLLTDLVNGMRTAEAGIAGLLPAASRPLNFDAVPKPETVEK